MQNGSGLASLSLGLFALLLVHYAHALHFCSIPEVLAFARACSECNMEFKLRFDIMCEGSPGVSLNGKNGGVFDVDAKDKAHLQRPKPKGKGKGATKGNTQVMTKKE